MEVLWGNFSGKGGVGKCWGVGPGKGKGGGGAEELRVASNVMGKIFAATGIEGKKGGEEGTEKGGAEKAEKAAKAEDEEEEGEGEEEGVLTAVCPLLSAQSMDGAAGDGLNGSYVSVGVCVHADLTPADLLIG